MAGTTIFLRCQANAPVSYQGSGQVLKAKLLADPNELKSSFFQHLHSLLLYVLTGQCVLDECYFQEFFGFFLRLSTL